MAKKLLMNSGGLMPVQDGLICWLDGRDGKNGDTVWKDRSGNGNDFELVGFTFDSTNGFRSDHLLFSPTSYVQSFKNLNDIIPNIDTSDVYVEVTYKTYELYKMYWKRVLQFPYPLSSYNRLMFLNSCNAINSENTDFTINANEAFNSIKIDKLKDKTKYYNTIGVNSMIKTSNNMITKAYCNGISIDGAKETFNSYPYNTKIMLNHTSNQDSLKMNISSVLIYNRALTDYEIKQNYEYEKSIQRG